MVGYVYAYGKLHISFATRIVIYTYGWLCIWQATPVLGYPYSKLHPWLITYMIGSCGVATRIVDQQEVA